MCGSFRALPSSVCNNNLNPFRPAHSDFSPIQGEMSVGTSWKAQWAQKREERRVKDYSDTIDRQLHEHSKILRKTCDILLIGLSVSPIWFCILCLGVVAQS